MLFLQFLLLVVVVGQQLLGTYHVLFGHGLGVLFVLGEHNFVQVFRNVVQLVLHFDDLFGARRFGQVDFAHNFAEVRLGSAAGVLGPNVAALSEVLFGGDRAVEGGERFCVE